MLLFSLIELIGVLFRLSTLWPLQMNRNSFLVAYPKVVQIGFRTMPVADDQVLCLIFQLWSKNLFSFSISPNLHLTYPSSSLQGSSVRLATLRACPWAESSCNFFSQAGLHIHGQLLDLLGCVLVIGVEFWPLFVTVLSFLIVGQEPKKTAKSDIGKLVFQIYFSKCARTLHCACAYYLLSVMLYGYFYSILMFISYQFKVSMETRRSPSNVTTKTDARIEVGSIEVLCLSALSSVFRIRIARMRCKLFGDKTRKSTFKSRSQRQPYKRWRPIEMWWGY
jgi:hypothetical protein